MGTLAITAAVQIGAGLLLNYLFPPPGINVAGPRLANKAIAGSSYGESWPIPYGTGRISTNMIWNQDITEIKIEEEVGGKGGGGGGTVTTYEYFGDGAVGVCEGPIDRILQIYASNKLIYDTTGTGKVTDVYEGVERAAIFQIRQRQVAPTTQGDAADDLAALGGIFGLGFVTAQIGLPMRFYDGDESQLPDPLIESVEGKGNVSAHRGLSYIVFEKLPLKNFGNTFPSVDVVYATDAPAGIVKQSLNPVISVHNDAMGFDHRRRRVMAVSNSGQMRVTFDDFGQTGETTDPIGTSAGFYTAIARDGTYYTFSGTRVDARDPNSFEITGFSPNVLLAPMAFLGAVRTVPDPPAVNTIDYVGAGSVGGGMWIFQDKPGALINVTPSGFASMIAGQDFSLANAVGGPIFANPVTGVFYIVQNWTAGSIDATAPIVLWQINMVSVEALDGELASAIDAVELFRFARNDVVNGFGGDRVDSGFYVEGDNSLVLQGDNSMLKFDLETNTIVARNEEGLPNFGRSMVHSRVTGGTFAYANGTAVSGTVYEINVQTLAVLRTTDIATFDSYSIVNDGFYDEDTASFTNDKNGMSKFFLNRATGNAQPLSTIVLDLCLRAGLTAAQVNVTALSSILVKGFVANPQSSARRHIEALMQAFLFDGIESAGVLIFTPRGQTSVRTIPFSDLGQLSEEENLEDPSGGRLNETRLGEQGLPARVTVLYSDEDRAYQQGGEANPRISAPKPAMFSLSEETIDLPVVMNATEAKQLAEKWIYNIWFGRTAFATLTHWKHLDLDVTDIITLELPSGDRTGRITRMDIGADLTIEMELQEENLEFYTAISSADDGFGFRQQIILNSSLTQPFFLDIPLLIAQDASAGQFTRPYFAMAGYSANWPGGVLFRSVDGGVTFIEAGASFSEVAWGGLSTILPNAPRDDHNYWDDTSSITFFPERGTASFSTKTDLEVLNGANAILVGSEILQFATVVSNADGSLTLSRFLRGRLGTNIFMASHVANERLILLTIASIDSMQLPLSTVNQQARFKAVTLSQILETADQEAFTYTGADLKPYAIVILEATRPGGDLVITWRRRTRYNRVQLVGVAPLNEATELYEVEIRANGVLLRTITGLTTPTATYTEAQWTADSGLLAAQYLIDNGDFESTSLAGWTTFNEFGNPNPANFLVVASSGALTGPQAGSTFLRTNEVIFSEPGIQQVKHLINDFALDAEEIRLGLAYTVEGYTGQPGPDTNDTMELSFEWLNSGGGVLATDTTGPITQAADDTWILRQFTGTVPKAARQLRVRFKVVSSGGAPLDPANGALDSVKVVIGTGVPKVEATVYQISEAVTRGFAEVGVI